MGRAREDEEVGGPEKVGRVAGKEIGKIFLDVK